MEYHNTKTGVTFSSSFVISGGDWILVDEKPSGKVQAKQVIHEGVKQEEKTVDEKQVQQEVEEEKTGNEAFDSITKDQIKQELDAFGIEYNPRAKKQELYDLMMARGEWYHATICDN